MKMVYLEKFLQEGPTFHSKQVRLSLISSKTSETSNKSLKKVRIFILLIGIVASLYQIICFTKSYLNYPVVVTLRNNDKITGLYPAVTVCNLNPMKNIYDICIKEEKTPDNCDSQKGKVSETDSGLFQFSMPLSKTLYSPTQNEMHNQSSSRALEFFNRYAKSKAETRAAYGIQAKHFIKYCSFKGSLCSSDDFELNQNLRFGNCYTFQPASFEKRFLQKSSLFSDHKDLEIILNLETQYYIKYVSESIGALATVHGVFEKPNVEEKGVLVSPGFETLVKVRITETKRLPAPYKDECMDYRSQLLTPKDCIFLCIQKINQEKCGCMDPTINVLESDDVTCNMTDVKHMECLNDVILNLLFHQSNCTCHVPCFSINYNEQVWKSSWPSKLYFNHYLRLKFRMRRRENFDYFKDNFAFLKIHLETAKEIIEQKPKYDISEFFSCLGGSLGLYLGISSMTIFEIIDILIALKKPRL